MWEEVEPFYPDATRCVPKTAESRGTESILDALILASYGAPHTRLALDNMWALQLKTGEAKGAWAWLQFHNSPCWEAGLTSARVIARIRGGARNMTRNRTTFEEKA
jgi:hypothetical protein